MEDLRAEKVYFLLPKLQEMAYLELKTCRNVIINNYTSYLLDC